MLADGAEMLSLGCESPTAFLPPTTLAHRVVSEGQTVYQKVQMNLGRLEAGLCHCGSRGLQP